MTLNYGVVSFSRDFGGEEVRIERKTGPSVASGKGLVPVNPRLQVVTSRLYTNFAKPVPPPLGQYVTKISPHLL